MLFPIERLIKDRDEPLCVTKEVTVNEALTLMLENDYSQLAVVDERGQLIGMVSEQSILRRFRKSDGKFSLLNLTIDHCLTQAATLPPESDIFEVLDRLKDVYALFIVENRKPLAILTDYDTTHFFRDLTEGLVMVEDIETTLRDYVEKSFPSPEELHQALATALPHPKQPGKPYTSYNRLSFYQLIQFIKHPRSWQKLGQYFAPQELFCSMIEEPVVPIRNQLAHFRGGLTKEQYVALMEARDWLATRPKPKEVQGQQVAVIDTELAPPAASGGKYSPLTAWLQRQTDGPDHIQVTFADIEKILGSQLPDSARNHRSWWANDFSRRSRSQAVAWLNAGWRVSGLDMTAEHVTFERSEIVQIQYFFHTLFAQFLEKEPSADNVTEAPYQHHFTMLIGHDQEMCATWVYDQDTLAVRFSPQAEGEQLKKLFATLKKEEKLLGQKLGESVHWNLPAADQPAFISVSKKVKADNLFTCGEWVLEKTMQFTQAFNQIL